MTSERNILLKTWDKLEDEAIIKDVATKGKYINLCISFLSKRNKINIAEARIYFYDKVYKYIESLIGNHQIFKAEHVLKNIDESPKYVLYDISKRTSDETLNNSIYEYLKKTFPDLNDDEMKDIEANWILLNHIKKYPIGDEVINHKGSFEGLNLNGFFKKDLQWRKKLAVEYFINFKLEKLINLIDKQNIWEYFLKKFDIYRISKWLNWNDYDDSAANNFEITLNSLIKNWEFNIGMLELIENYPTIYSNDIIATGLARQGYFINAEIDDIFQIIYRVYSAKSIEKNYHVIKSKENSIKIINYLADNELYVQLVDILINFYNKNLPLIETINKNSNTEFIYKIFEANDNIEEISKLSSKYLKEYHDVNFYTNNPFASYVDGEITDFEVPNFVHYNQFLENYANGYRFKHDPETFLFKVLKKKHYVDLKKLKLLCGTDELPHFNHPQLIKEYSQPVKLNYLYFLKRCRSSYAVYIFFVDQLQNYSKISNEQLYNSAVAVSEIALNNFRDQELAAHCVAFIEMIGFDTIGIRSFLKVLRFCSNNLPVQNLIDQKNELTNKKIMNTFEKTLNDKLEENIEIHKLYSYIEAAINICDITEIRYPESFLIKFAEKNDWKSFIILSEICKYSLKQVIDIARNNFQNSIMGHNLILAITNQYHKKTPHLHRRLSFSQRREMSSSTTSNISSNEISLHTYTDKKDLFGILLSTQFVEQQDILLNREDKTQRIRWPLLYVLFTLQLDNEPYIFWKYWLIDSTKYDNELIYTDYAIVKYAVSNNFVRTLHESFQIFFPETPILFLTNYLVKTSKLDFSEEAMEKLQEYLTTRTNNNALSFIHLTDGHIQELLLIHLNNNVKSNYYRRIMINQYNNLNLNFTFNLQNLLNISKICELSKVRFNFKRFENIHDENEAISYYNKIIEKLILHKEFDRAMEISNFIDYNREIIIYENWLEKYSNENLLNFENELEVLNLNPEFLIKFYLKISSDLILDNKNKYIKKYNILKNCLNSIKKYKLHPNENFDRDSIEYELILCYIKIKLDHPNLDIDIYHSEFYENVLCNDRFVIRYTFLELKVIAGIDELSVCNKKLNDTKEIEILEKLILKQLNDNDIVEAIRLQAMFDHKPTDLHFIVFCMALAENLTNIHDLSSHERQLLTEKHKSFRFNRKRTLQTISLSSSPSPSTSSGGKQNDVEFCDNIEFEEIPPREKQEVLDVIQGLSSRLQNGFQIAERIVMIYRAAMYLEKEYIDILRIKDFTEFLDNFTNEDCFNKITIIHDVMTSLKMTPEEIGEFVADEVTETIIKSRFYLLQNSDNFGNNILWGHDINREFHLFLELCPDAVALGRNLLEFCDGLKLYRRSDFESDDRTLPKLRKMMENQVLSHKKQNTITVELMIKAHDCFVNVCYMEGIVEVLQHAKILTAILTNAKSWNLIVRMLNGIGRYREMYYCFETLIKNDQFESLLGKFDDQETNALQNAIISYLNEFHPENTEFYRLTASHFCMYKELARMWDNEAKSLLASILSVNEIIREIPTRKKESIKIPFLKYSDEMSEKLELTMEKYANATHNLILDNKLGQAQKLVSSAELISLQLGLFKIKFNKTNGNSKETISILNIRTYGIFRYIVNCELNIPQAMILTNSYDTYEINWAETIFHQYILLNRQEYFKQFLLIKELTDSIVENIVKLYQMESNITPRMEDAICEIIKTIKSVTLKYKLASLLGLKDIIAELINGSSIYYLKDSDYGKREIL